MKKQTRWKFSSSFKAKVAFEAAKNQVSLADLAKKFEVSPAVISRWKVELMNNMAVAFEKTSLKENESVDTQELYAQIGELKVEDEF